MKPGCSELKESGCSLDYYEKNAYFHGKLITARDMVTEQRSNEEKLYTINRLVNGRGIVRGLKVENLRADGGRLMVDIHPGLALDCCGRLVVVKDGGGAFPMEVKKHDGRQAKDSPGEGRLYLYLRYKESLKEAVPVPEVGDALQEKCCYNHILETFDIVARKKDPEPCGSRKVKFPTRKEAESDIGCAVQKMVLDYHGQVSEEGCGGCSDPMVFLGVFSKPEGGTWVQEMMETEKHLSMVYGNELLFDIMAAHVTRYDNPHDVKVSRTGTCRFVKVPPGGTSVSVDILHGLEGMTPAITLARETKERMLSGDIAHFPELGPAPALAAEADADGGSFRVHLKNMGDTQDTFTVRWWAVPVTDDMGESGEMNYEAGRFDDSAFDRSTFA